MAFFSSQYGSRYLLNFNYHNHQLFYFIIITLQYPLHRYNNIILLCRVFLRLQSYYVRYLLKFYKEREQEAISLTILYLTAHSTDMHTAAALCSLWLLSQLLQRWCKNIIALFNWPLGFEYDVICTIGFLR